MLIVEAALQGYAIEASDGRIGTFSDALFEDTTWNVRWLASTRVAGGATERS